MQQLRTKYPKANNFKIVSFEGFFITMIKSQNKSIFTDVINSIDIKTSFEPIADNNSTILILGSLPGDKSLELQEYYGHPRNRFWKIIASITQSDLPLTYNAKKELLLKSKIGIWDVAHKANRKGSLDSFIKDVEPNNISGFIENHLNLKVIGFNGSKSQSLYDRYFTRKHSIKYISLPSSSPANASISFENICKKWSEILEY